MKATVLDLRRRTSEIMAALDRNETVTIFYRGRPKGIMYPARRIRKKRRPITEHPAFGMWKDRKDMEDVEAYLRRMREGRRYVI